MALGSTASEGVEDPSSETAEITKAMGSMSVSDARFNGEIATP